MAERHPGNRAQDESEISLPIVIIIPARFVYPRLASPGLAKRDQRFALFKKCLLTGLSLAKRSTFLDSTSTRFDNRRLRQW
ncbi:hypothetical protein CGGC5_v010381 [Colletotrichum fructicola Nara gc5]|uniref:Uncharacterized protein n=1 Tax=Colletotrichum fructicola (strain Nara gc5) TaxID=1213859 RepID=A0A7J6IZ14_COLFN|nr:hypothetical protein CGGC5_v010381 [Colletotrichum fructicola Nara gc5]KAF5488289.1 hypothetical protein CGCF413_v011981 [Colletotrichum fructicola]